MAVPIFVANGWYHDAAIFQLNGAISAIGSYDPALNSSGPAYATLAHAYGEINGYSDPQVAAWYATAAAARSPMGGYGPGTVLDGNPANTTYMITTACFVGMHLLAGRQHGVVPQADLDAVIDCVRFWPCFAYNWGISGQPGGLPDYSSTPTGGATAQHSDDRIWNIIAAAATFLLYCRGWTDSARTADCNTRGTAWKNAVVWAMNRPSNFGGWGYRGVTSTIRQDGTHNWLCADMSPWLPGGVAPLMTQMSAGITAGDRAATTTGTPELCYIGGAAALMARHPEAIAGSLGEGAPCYADALVGRIAATLGSGSAGAALNLWGIHTLGSAA
ncbi:MAG: hypothetical protein ACRDU4_00735, partial [Mycobacterium sp.]